jgi:hypothetical protein
MNAEEILEFWFAVIRRLEAEKEEADGNGP